MSVLSSISKVFEDILCDQTTEYFYSILSRFLCAYRKKYGCQDVLSKYVEDIKQALDNGLHVGSVLMDLSKAFDSLPHKLLLAKVHAYGASSSACKLFHSYLCNRYQCVKIKTVRSIH